MADETINGPGTGSAAAATPPASEKDVVFTPAQTGSVGEDAREAKRTAKQAVKEEADNLQKHATEKARGYAQEGKSRATGALDELAKMIEDTAGTVDDKMGAQYGDYARSAAGTVSGFSNSLRDKEVEELIEDTRAFVRASPAVAIGTAAALGFVLARIVKSGFEEGATAADSRV